jgi:hypothetical protein
VTPVRLMMSPVLPAAVPASTPRNPTSPTSPLSSLSAQSSPSSSSVSGFHYSSDDNDDHARPHAPSAVCKPRKNKHLSLLGNGRSKTTVKAPRQKPSSSFRTPGHAVRMRELEWNDGDEEPTAMVRAGCILYV